MTITKQPGQRSNGLSHNNIATTQLKINKNRVDKFSILEQPILEANQDDI
jgi:hypothetical protein